MESSPNLELALQEAQRSRDALLQTLAPFVKEKLGAIKEAIDFHLLTGFSAILEEKDLEEEEFLDRFFEGKTLSSLKAQLTYVEEEPALATLLEIEDAMLGVFDAFFKVSMRSEQEIRRLILEARKQSVIPLLKEKMDVYAI